MPDETDDEKVVPLRTGVPAILAFVDVHALGGDRNRPYIGQPWTLAGERGATQVTVSLRDIADSIVRSLRGWEWTRSDAQAIAMNAMVQLQEDLGMELPK